MKRTREEQVARDVVYEVVCDGCGEVAKGSDPDGWHEFSSYHGDWGNDSVDSHDEWDVCSGQCYFKKVRELFEGYSSIGEPPTLMVDGKDYLFVKSMLRVEASDG